MDIDTLLKNNPAVILYFTAGHCNVCKVLKPAIKEMIHDVYPEIVFQEIDTNEFPDLAAKYQAFSIPLILVFFDGKEFFRKGRAMSVRELTEEIKRPYSMLLD